MGTTTELGIPLDDLADDLETIRAAKAEMKKWKDVLDAAVGKVEARLGESEIGTIDGHVVVRYPHRAVTRLDTSRLRGEVPAAVLNAYLKITTERRFELVD